MFCSEFAYVFRLSVSMRNFAGKYPFSVLIYMNSYMFHFCFILFILLSYLIFVFVCLALSLAYTHGIAKYACTYREIMLFIGKPKGRSMMISNATNALRESRKESLLRCTGSTSICEWLVCDLVVMCVQAVGDRALGDLCVCVRCGSVQSQKV